MLLGKSLAYHRAVRIVFAGFMTVLVLTAAELAARMLEIFGPRTFVFKQFDPVLGLGLIPGRSGIHRSCFDGFVSINSHGMRDAERTHEKPAGRIRVGVFGDSVVEGLHVYPGQLATQRLEKRLNRQLCQGICEALNFGIGGFGTLQELLRYRRDGKPFGLDVVALVFVGNDVHNNILNNAYDPNYYAAPWLEVTVDGRSLIHYPEKPPAYDLLKVLMEHFAAFRYAYKIYFHVIVPRRAPTVVHDGIPRAMDIIAPGSPITERSWDITKRLLDEFNAEVIRDGARMVVLFADYDMPSPNEAERQMMADFERETGYTVDTRFATHWFEAWSKQSNVPVIPFGTRRDDYIAANGLDAGPRLSYSCDTHLNPEGHAILADALYEGVAPIVEEIIGHPTIKP